MNVYLNRRTEVIALINKVSLAYFHVQMNFAASLKSKVSLKVYWI